MVRQTLFVRCRKERAGKRSFVHPRNMSASSFLLLPSAAHSLDKYEYSLIHTFGYWAFFPTLLICIFPSFRTTGAVAQSPAKQCLNMKPSLKAERGGAPRVTACGSCWKRRTKKMKMSSSRKSRTMRNS